MFKSNVPAIFGKIIQFLALPTLHIYVYCFVTINTYFVKNGTYWILILILILILIILILKNLENRKYFIF